MFPKKYVLAVDLDYFYAQCEEVLNPELKGKPIAIQQKNIIVTSNPEARSLGVGKLSSLWDVKKKEGVVVVNGEDIGKYRRFSNQVWKFVKDYFRDMGDVAIERLGSDEFFIDLSRVVTGDDGGEVVGTILSGCDRKDYEDERMKHAARIAHGLRLEIERKVGLTCSTVVASSKLLAKLASGIVKPCGEAVLPEEELYDSKGWINQVAREFPLAKVHGLGYQTRKRILEGLGGVYGEEPAQFIDLNGGGVTIGVIQDVMSISTCERLFEDGKRIWELIHLVEDGEVVNTGLSKQISVEDTFKGLGCGAWFGSEGGDVGDVKVLAKVLFREDVNRIGGLQEARERLTFVVMVLLDRLEGEEMEDGVWRRYPRQMRVTVRFGRNARVSRTIGGVPGVEYFQEVGKDGLEGLKARAEVVVGRIWPVFKRLCEVESRERINDLNMINVACLGFEETLKREVSVVGFVGIEEEEVDEERLRELGVFDLEVWKGLPREVRRGVLKGAIVQDPRAKPLDSGGHDETGEEIQRKRRAGTLDGWIKKERK